MMFRPYSNTSKYFLRDYISIAMVIFSLVKINMLFAGWEVRIVKNSDRGLENAARGRGQHFQARGHSFSLNGPTLSRQIAYLFFPGVNWLTSGFVYATWLTCRLQTFVKNLTNERASNSDTR